MKTLSLAAVLILAASAPLLAQEDSHQAHGGGGASAEIKARLPFDKKLVDGKETFKGEVWCQKGKVQGDSIKFDICRKKNVDKYQEEAISKHIIEADKVPTLNKEIKDLASKLAFLDSARAEVKKKLEELKDKQATMDYKKLKGMKDKLKDELKDSIDLCKTKPSDKIKCPEPPAQDD